MEVNNSIHLLGNVNLYARIVGLCKISGDTMYSLAKGSGVSESVLSRLKTNPQSKLSRKNLILLANYFCVNEDWLATGQGDIDAPGITKDTIIHDSALHERFIEVSQEIYGIEEIIDGIKVLSNNIDLDDMSMYTDIPQDRLADIIYDKKYPSYTEVIDLLKSDKRINANWLFLGVDKMFKESMSIRESERITALVDTITQLQFAINAKSETIAALNERIKQLEQQIKE